jgi:site-specific DNA-cytosine methylase
MTYTAVDCQSFAGGFTLGMVQAGFRLTGKREMKGGFGVANCEANRHLLGDSWWAEAVDPGQWSAPTMRPDVVFGNPPCSGFSVMSHKDFRGADSPINSCMWAFVEYAARCRPTIAVFESVQMARTRPDGLDLMRRLRNHLEELTGDYYTLHHVRHNALAVGGAAMRKRYFWVVSAIPFGIVREKKRHVPRLRDIFSDLDNLALAWGAQAYRQPPTWWSKDKRSDSGVVDGQAAVSSPLSRRLYDLMTVEPWHPGEHMSKVIERYYDRTGTVPASWAGFKDHMISREFQLGFTQPCRWNGDNYARVITGGSPGSVIHPTLDRLITFREVARVMGFPDDWKIAPLRHNPGMVMTWGKGITVQCGKWIGKQIHNALDGNPGDYPGEPLGDREFDINVTNDYVPLS